MALTTAVIARTASGNSFPSCSSANFIPVSSSAAVSTSSAMRMRRRRRLLRTDALVVVVFRGDAFCVVGSFDLSE
jgi:hypothetical protein